jgi:hypothetical protein
MARPKTLRADAKFWTDAERRQMFDLAVGGMMFADIGEKMGRSKDSIAGQFNEMCHALLPAEREAIKDRRFDALRLPITGRCVVGPLAPVIASPTPRYRNLSAAQLGDPPIGRSALDMRNGISG